jgi:hypothetical protein
MAVRILTYGSEIKFVAGYTRKDQIRNTRIGEKLNIFNASNKILKSRSQWKYHVL